MMVFRLLLLTSLDMFDKDVYLLWFLKVAL